MVLALCSNQNDGTRRCWFSRPAKHHEASLYVCVLLVNGRANSRAVNPYIPSVSKKVTGLPSCFVTTAFRRDCCYAQSLCNSLCARTEGWNSWSVTIKPTHTYNWNWADYSFALVASWTTSFQAWCISFHWIDSSGRKAQWPHTYMNWYITYTGQM